MQLIRSVTTINPIKPNGKTILYMHGHGARTWQARRQLKSLEQAGYRIIALDFSFTVQSSRPGDLAKLIEEVESFIKTEDLLNPETILVGISLGGLVGYNMIRRQPKLQKLLVITGGNIVLLPSKKILEKWGMSRSELLEAWHDVNIFYPEGKLQNKHIIMLLPKRDRIIKPNEVVTEIQKQATSSRIKLIRTNGGHFRTIITETILKPKKILNYLHQLENY